MYFRQSLQLGNRKYLLLFKSHLSSWWTLFSVHYLLVYFCMIYEVNVHNQYSWQLHWSFFLFSINSIELLLTWFLHVKWGPFSEILDFVFFLPPHPLSPFFSLSLAFALWTTPSRIQHHLSWKQAKWHITVYIRGCLNYILRV